MAKIYLIGFLLLIKCPAFCQQVKITGIVDAVRQPLDAASVQLKSYGSNSTISYCYTDQDGKYTLAGTIDQSDRFLLIASYIGYKKDTIILSRIDLLNTSVYLHNFHLEEDENLLKEIYIKAPPPIQVDNDTTTYNVARFASPADRNLEDVLRKMPGFEVDRSGTISFKGKRIGKVLLDGDDLTGQGYKAITKNIKPELVEEVQALEHFVEDDLLKGIINSDDVAINLKVKNKQSRRIVGGLDFGAGISDRIAASASLISLLNDTKAFELLKHNNVNSDYDLVSDVNQDWQDNRLINHNVATYNPFDNIDYTEKTTSQFSINALTRVTEKFKIKYGATYYRNRSIAKTSLLSTYYKPASVKIANSESMYNIKKLFTGNFDTDYLVKPSARLSSKFSFKQSPQKYNSSAYSSFNSVVGDSVLEKQKDVDNSFLGELKYTLKADARTAYLVSAKLVTNSINQNYVAESNLYASVSMFNGAQELLQKVKVENSIATINFEALKKYSANYLYLNVGGQLNRYKLETSLFSERTQSIAEFQNEGYFNSDRGYAVAKYVYDIKYFKIQALLKTTLLNLDAFRRDTLLFLTEPTLIFSYQTPDQLQNISLTYNFKNNEQQPTNYYQSYILKDVRNVSRGLGDFFNFNTHSSALSYNYNDFTNSFLSAGASINVNYSERGFLYNSTFVNTLNYTEKRPYRGMKVWGSTINVKKFIPFLSTMLTGFYNIAQSTYFGQLVQEIKKYQSINQSFTIKLNTGFDLPINFGADFNVQTNRIKSEQIEIASAKALKATLGYQLKVGNFYNGTSIDLYRMNSQNFNWIDSEIQYNPTKGSFKYRLIGKNLTDLRAFSNINVSEISTSNFSASILGRYLLMSVSYSLR
jgi:hypothetical protein